MIEGNVGQSISIHGCHQADSPARIAGKHVGPGVEIE